MKLSIQRTLLLSFAGLMALLVLVLVSLSMHEERRLVRHMAGELQAHNQALANAALGDLFDPISAELVVYASQVESGLVDNRDPVAMKDMLLGRVQQLHGVSSVMMGDPSGYQCLLMAYDELVTGSPLLEGQPGLPMPDPAHPQYFTREFDPDRWGSESRWTIWDSTGRKPVAEFVRDLPGYDPRRRPWHIQAMERLAALESGQPPASPADGVAWTGAYTMFTSKTPGISASIAARDPDGEITIFAYDVLLNDLSNFTRATHPTPGSQVFILTDEGKVLGLPEDERYVTEAQRSAILMQPLSTVGKASLQGWLETWERGGLDGEPFTWQVDGETWWGGGARFAWGGEHGFWVGLAVPQRDLLERVGHEPYRALWVAAAGLGLAMILAFVVSRRVSRPLERMVERSRRIGALDLLPEPYVPSSLLEIQELDQALDATRARLKEHIDDRDRTHAALAESEERFRTTFEQSAVGVCNTSLTGAFLLVNARLARMLGRSASTLIGMRAEDLTHADDIEQDDRVRAGFLDGSWTSHRSEKRFVCADGSPIWSQVTTSLRRNEAGQPLYFISVVEDISLRRELESRLQRAQKLEAVGRLAGGVAHDFNNLLTVIKGYTALVSKHLGDTLEERSRRHLAHVQQAVDSGEALTRQLLAFARKNQGDPRVVDAGQVVQESLGLLEQLVRGVDGDASPALHIEMNIAAGSHPVRIDPVQLQQVLVNLVVNARDAMPTGGTISVAVRKGELDSGLEAVIVEVGDEGIGMEPELIERIFDPFFSTKTVGKGTGLGLAICYGIAEAAKGRLFVTSAKGAGSTFALQLPRSDRPQDVHSGLASHAHDFGTTLSPSLEASNEDA